MLDAVGWGNLRPLSHWLKGRSELPVLRGDDGCFVTHPHRVGEELARFWGGVLAIPPPDIQEHHIRDMTRDMPKETLDWQSLEACDYWEHCRQAKESAMGNDRIPLSLLKALPKHAWNMVAAVFKGIECGLPWPQELCDVLLCAIPQSDSSGSGAVGPNKYRMIN